MKTIIIAIDPGNKAGISHGNVEFPESVKVESFDFTPKKATKSRAGELEHMRYGQLLQTLIKIKKTYESEDSLIHVVCEDAQAFTRGKSAVQVSNQYRGVVKAFAAVYDLPFFYLQPADLKKAALGKGVGEKEEMVRFAREKLNYKGNDDNEADSLIMWHWLKEQLKKHNL